MALGWLLRSDALKVFAIEQIHVATCWLAPEDPALASRLWRAADACMDALAHPNE